MSHNRAFNAETPVAISVAMPIYNCAATLDLAVQSILNQTFGDFELLLLDDGSTDGTAALAGSYSDPRIRVFTDGQHLGLVPRLNQAIGLSRGKYYGRMDGDDVAYPERFALQAKFLEEHPEIDLVGGGIIVFGRNGRPLGTRKCPANHEEICRRPSAGFASAHTTWLGKMDWFGRHFYRVDAVRAEDQDLLLRTYQYSRFAAVPEIVLGYREEELSLKKILVGRRSYVQAAFRQGFRTRNSGLGWAALAGHTCKGLLDCMAVGTGLGHRLLRHRARAIDEASITRWTEVWRSLHKRGPVTTFEEIPHQSLSL